MDFYDFWYSLEVYEVCERSEFMEDQKSKVISFKLSEEMHRRFKATTALRGETQQSWGEQMVAVYVAKFEGQVKTDG